MISPYCFRRFRFRFFSACHAGPRTACYPSEVEPVNDWKRSLRYLPSAFPEKGQR